MNDLSNVILLEKRIRAFPCSKSMSASRFVIQTRSPDNIFYETYKRLNMPLCKWWGVVSIPG